MDIEALTRQSCYLFVDGAMFRKQIGHRTKVVYGERIYPSLQYMLRHANAQKLFWFDCEPDDTNKTKDDVSLDIMIIRDLVHSTPMCHFIDGYLSSGRRKKQKAVDVGLAVYALDFALRNIITKVTLVAGDGDFMHLVQNLVRHGTTVSVWCDDKVVSNVIKDEADDYQSLNTLFIHRLLSEIDQERLGHPHGHQVDNFQSDTQIAKVIDNVDGIDIIECEGRYHAFGHNGYGISHVNVKLIREWVKDGCRS